MSKLDILQRRYADLGYLVLAANGPLPLGPVDNWISYTSTPPHQDLATYRWSIVADSNVDEFAQQVAAIGWSTDNLRRDVYFYRVVALD